MQIGIDLGGSHIAVGIVSERNNIVSKKEMDIFKVQPESEMKEYLIDNIKILINQVLREVGAPSCVLSKIAIAIPGKVKNNIAYDIYNLGITEFDICKILEEHYGVEVKVRNDAKCAALAEKEKGSLIGYDDCVFLCIGTGIGGATFINGRMIEYSKEWGSEYGHMIIEKDGIECNCGNKGCWERYASMRAFKDGIIKLLKLPEDIDSESIVRLLKDKINVNDPVIDQYISEYLDNVIVGISNIVNIIQPEAISIGGGFVYYDEILFDRLRIKINNKHFNGKTPRIMLAKLQNDAGMIGSLI